MKFLIDGQTLSTPEINRGIGVVFQRVLAELVLNDISKEWFIAIRDISDLRYLSSEVRTRLVPILVGEALAQDTYIKQTQSYSQLLNKVVTELEVDAYWMPNPLMMNVVLPTDLCNVTIFATVYDLIPLLMPNLYLAKWSEPIKVEYKRRIEILPIWADKLIFISESAKRDFEKIEPRVASKSVAIPLAVDHTKFWSLLAPKNNSQEPYILFTGGFDPRKNMNAALEAFAYLVKDKSQEVANLKFYVICACADEDRQNYENLAAKLGVLDRLVLTGYVDEDKLVSLYRGASVFFFPSRYEGFGLPVLEALACGLPVVTTKVSSIPEIVGDLAYYCSSDDPKDMATALRKALGDGISGRIRRQEYISRAREFTWAKTGANYFRVFTNTLCNAHNSKHLNRYKIAYVSPWLPQRSGIANYSYEIVSYLKEYVDITLYVESFKDCSQDSFNLVIKNLSVLPEEIKKYDCIIYHIGNNIKFHKEIYKIAWQYPGIVVLHEFNIHPFLAESFLNTENEYLYADALKKGYQEQGVTSYKDIKDKSIPPEIWKFPMSHALVKRSLAIIVHSQWVKSQLQENNNVFVVPHGSVDKTSVNVDSDLSALKKRFGILDNHFLVSTFGFVNVLKRIPTILEAMSTLIERGYPIQFFIGGELIDSSLKIEERIKSLGIANNIIISGYLSDEDFEQCIKMSDIVLNLRYPSLGESSGALMKALSYGKACIVSNYQQFAELSNSVCWKADINDLEVPQLIAYLEELMRNPAARKQLGKNAAFFTANYSSYEMTANLYAEIISRIMLDNKLNKRESVTLKLPKAVAVKIEQLNFEIIGSKFDKSLIQHIKVNSSYEPHLQISLMKFISDGDVCIDIGANIGVHSILMSKLVGASGQVYCYEASPNNHSYLKQNLKLNNCTNVKTEQVGLWDEHTELEFSYVEEVAGCSFFSTTGIREGEKQIIACKPLDSLTSNYPPKQQISAIKIDCEGAELHVLRGAIKTIKKHLPVIFLEINPVTIKRFFSANYQELYQIISDLDYSMYWLKLDNSLNKLKGINDLQAIFDNTNFQWIDVVCLPNKRKFEL